VRLEASICYRLLQLVNSAANEEKNQPSRRIQMRSDLVFEAMARVSGRFLLTKVVSKTTRQFHKPNTRIQDTTNAVFVRFSRADPIAGVRRIPQLTTVPLRRAS
jgi:hypothetical protein